MSELYRKRFSELIVEADRILADTHMGRDRFGGSGPFVKNDALLAWRLKTENLLSQVTGEGSRHLVTFHGARLFGIGESNHSSMLRQYALFLAAKEDFDGGYLQSQRSLIHAEVFTVELEQAEELQDNGYYVAAAVIAGIVLETAMRELCRASGIETGKLDRMNADLAKAGKYDALVAKRITWLAGVRNAAAHGDTAKFRDADVEPMIQDVSRLLTQLVA